MLWRAIDSKAWAGVLLKWPKCGRYWIAMIMAAAALAGCTSRASLMYRRAEIFFGQGKYELALAEYERIVEKFPSDSIADDALYKIGHLYRVHLHKPAQAVAAYMRLARDYPHSPYAPAALLWCAHIWARTFASPSQAESVCKMLDSRFPRHRRARARAYLELARAFVSSGQIARARQAAQMIREQFGEQKNIAAAAALLECQAARQAKVDAAVVGKMLEEIVRAYPGTVAAEQAQRELGLFYYAQRKREEKQRREQMKREQRWMADIPGFERWTDPRLTMLDGLCSLLRCSGCAISLPVAAAMSGKALIPVVPFDGRWPELWTEDPLMAVAQACGMVPSVWVTEDKAQAWEAVRRAIVAGQPCLVAYGSPEWVIVGGWQPEREIVGVLQPGSSALRAVHLKKFMSRWRPAKEVAPFVQWPADAYYVLTISGQRARMEATELNREALKGLEGSLTEGSSSLPQPHDLAREVATKLSRAGQERPFPRQWYEVGLRRWAEVRRVLADFLEPIDGQLSRDARHIADVIGSLREALIAAEDSEAPQREYQAAASIADRLASEEENLSDGLARLLAAQGL